MQPRIKRSQSLTHIPVPVPFLDESPLPGNGQWPNAFNNTSVQFVSKSTRASDAWDSVSLEIAESGIGVIVRLDQLSGAAWSAGEKVVNI